MASADETITNMADDVAKKADKAAKTASVKAANFMDDVREEVVKGGQVAKEHAKDAAKDSKNFAADAIEGLASAAREVAEKLRDSNPTGAKAADFARDAAGRMEHFSSRLREKELGELADDARSVVRKNPAIALGAAAVIGFALARFLKGDGEA